MTYMQGGPRHGAAKHGPRAVGGARAMGSAPRTPHVLVVSAREHPVAAALEQHGYIVLRARTGAAAAAAVNDAQQAPPDALPVIDGGAVVDPATGLYDVQGLARCARDLTRRAFNHRAPLACVVLAPEVVDGAADDAAVAQVLTRVAKALKTSGRQSDAFGRIGPNEFAIIAPGSDAQGAMTLAARLLQAVEGGTGEPGDPAPRVRLHAGYDAVPNARYAPL